MNWEYTSTALFLFGLWLLIVLFFSWLFWLLWGWIAVPVFGAPQLSFLQALGLWFLLGIIGSAFKK